MNRETVIIDNVEYEIHVDGLKEVCPFCPEEQQCKTTWCPYTEEE